MQGIRDGAIQRERHQTSGLDDVRKNIGLTLQELKETAREITWKGKVMDVTKGQERPDGISKPSK